MTAKSQRHFNSDFTAAIHAKDRLYYSRAVHSHKNTAERIVPISGTILKPNFMSLRMQAGTSLQPMACSLRALYNPLCPQAIATDWCAIAKAILLI